MPFPIRKQRPHALLFFETPDLSCFHLSRGSHKHPTGLTTVMQRRSLTFKKLYIDNCFGAFLTVPVNHFNSFGNRPRPKANTKTVFNIYVFLRGHFISNFLRSTSTTCFHKFVCFYSVIHNCIYMSTSTKPKHTHNLYVTQHQ